MNLDSARQIIGKKGRGLGLLEIFVYLYGDLSESEKERLTNEKLLIDGKPNVDLIYSLT